MKTRRENKENEMNTDTGDTIREHLTVLLKRRSVTALCCGILTLLLAFYGIIAGVNKTITVFHVNGFMSFSYYTMVSNLFAALSAAFVFPYTVEGIRKKRFILPKWVSVIHYMATVTITITMVFVLAFMSWSSPEDAFGGSNIVTHVFCPIFILISFFQIESGKMFSWKDRLLGIIPFFLYLAVYFIEVVIIGAENGGWQDLYQIRDYLSPFLAIPALLLLAFGVSTAIAFAANQYTKNGVKKTYLLWREDLDPVEVRIEAYGLGRMISLHSEKESIQIPYDILEYLAERYHLKTEDLMKPFVKGLLIGLDELNKGNELNDRQTTKS